MNIIKNNQLTMINKSRKELDDFVNNTRLIHIIICKDNEQMKGYNIMINSKKEFEDVTDILRFQRAMDYITIDELKMIKNNLNNE